MERHRIIQSQPQWQADELLMGDLRELTRGVDPLPRAVEASARAIFRWRALASAERRSGR